jgi:short-subunit dehydrogenase
MFFTSSILGEIPMYSASLYSSTKHAMNGFFYSLQQELLARESPVSLTVGAFGLILTKQVKETFGDGPNPFYDWANGGLEGCARGMVEAYVTRPQTMTFSRLTGLTYRPLWYFAPNFLHEEMIRKIKAYVESYRK